MRRILIRAGRQLTVSLLVVLTTSCTRARGSDDPPDAGRTPAQYAGREHTAIVERFIVAYNAQDIDALLALAHPDIEWLSVDGATVSIETEGAAALRDALQRYWTAVPTSRSALEGFTAIGRFVSVIEHAHWEERTGPRSQRSLAIYEIETDLIRRVWYFPAQP